MTPVVINLVFDTRGAEMVKKEESALFHLTEYRGTNDSNGYGDLFRNSSLLWWKRFFDVGYYLCYVPYRFVPVGPLASPAFTIVQNKFNTITCITCIVLAIMTYFRPVAELFSPEEPRYDLLQWMTEMGSLITHLAIYYTIWFRKSQILILINEYTRIWNSFRTKLPHENTNHFRLSTFYWLFFAVMQVSYLVELGYINGWSFDNIFASICSQTFIFDTLTCSQETLLWEDIGRVLVNFWSNRSLVAIVFAGDMFFLSSCIIYGRCLEEIGRFHSEEDYQILVKRYAQLRHIVALINKTTGLAVFVIVVGGMPFYVGHVPQLIGNYANNTLRLNQVRLVIYFLYYIGIFVWTSKRYHQVQTRLQFWLEKRENISQMGTLFNYQVFYSELNTNSKLAFAPCGIFRFNYDFCKALLSFAATYSIILVQMRPKN